MTFTSWCLSRIHSWIEDYYYKALQWVLQQSHVVRQSRVGIAYNGLSQVQDASTKEEFLCGLIRGFCGNLEAANQTKLAKEVR